jgi:hypothetical protein
MFLWDETHIELSREYIRERERERERVCVSRESPGIRRR